jgi:hypothetical protein
MAFRAERYKLKATKNAHWVQRQIEPLAYLDAIDSACASDSVLQAASHVGEA